jgi:carbonic anhydrase
VVDLCCTGAGGEQVAAKGHQMTSESDADAVELVAPSTPAHYEQVQELFVELMAWDCTRVSELGFDSALTQQFYYGQVAAPLPGEYAPPDGRLLWAKYAGNSAGCGAYTKLSPGICELKRVYVRTQYRGKKLGRQIVRCLLDCAQRNQYGLMRLETVSFMRSAIAMYREIGFRECPAYYEIPEGFRDITLFMELDLRGQRSFSAGSHCG